MGFISGENRQQIIMLPDCMDDYMTDDNAVHVIGAYINSLDLTVLSCKRPQPNTTGRLYEPDTFIAVAGNGKQTKPGITLATPQALPGSQNDS